jgi:hypothetical protein
VQLERRGVRTVTIVTEVFANLAMAQARVRGRGDLPLVVIPHPVGGLRPAELTDRVARAAGQLGSAPRPLAEPS